jgi:pimeloyl-ACP methyl ester carboxylesterase
MPSVEVNGINLHYEEAGEGPAVVFLHGAAGNHMSWWQQIPTFRQHYRCISIDHRGFGRSLDTTSEGQARFVDDLEALLAHIEVESTALVAQSMGGRTALGFTVRHPERATALVMADTWGFFNWPELQEKVRQIREADQDRDQPLTHRALGQRFQESEPAKVFLYRQLSALNPPRGEQPEITDAPTRDQVAKLNVPVLFLVGSDDQLAPPAILHRVHEIIENSEYVELEGLGHSVYFEDPVAFNEVVGDFLARHVLGESAEGQRA